MEGGVWVKGANLVEIFHWSAAAAAAVVVVVVVIEVVVVVVDVVMWQLAILSSCWVCRCFQRSG